MRRWNGWGDPAVDYPIPPTGLEYLQGILGVGRPIEDAEREQILATIPPSRLSGQPGLATAADVRLTHARGQSLPDWIALRYGRLSTTPDAVAYPESEAEVRALLDLGQRLDAHLIPYGGGTSVVGHINPLPSDHPTLTVDLSRLNRLLAVDETSRLATFEAGVRGPQIEAQLVGRGFTLGHFPQSFEYSTLGGWIATRSSGQQSLYYGRIEDLFAGGHLEAPSGPLDLLPFPASAAGPDLRHTVLGCEGRLGIITRATVRIRPRPSDERFSAVFFRSWPEGVEAVRQAVQRRLPFSMLRLSDPVETDTTLRLGGRPSLVRWGRRALGALGYGDGCCLLIVGSTDRRLGARVLGGLPAGAPIGEIWRRSRFRTPYLRNSLWSSGYALDTVETAVPWSQVVACARAMISSLGEAQPDEPVLAFAHLSHVYVDGASIYATFLFPRRPDPDEMLDRWLRMKASVSRAILDHGGTISHQHGVGLDHAGYLAREKGPAGIAVLTAACRVFDPEGRMNPGKLLPLEAPPGESLGACPPELRGRQS
ncbi:MAG TPA: FAD-binding oxidoreductase [Anaerolineales bacterium]|nr:FAD-binding oxidoreductase [Anaerolineales bacterium]